MCICTHAWRACIYLIRVSILLHGTNVHIYIHNGVYTQRHLQSIQAYCAYLYLNGCLVTLFASTWSHTAHQSMHRFVLCCIYTFKRTYAHRCAELIPADTYIDVSYDFAVLFSSGCRVILCIHMIEPQNFHAQKLLVLTCVCMYACMHLCMYVCMCDVCMHV